MGYSHRFSYTPGAAAVRDIFPQLVADARTIIDLVAESGIHIAGWAGGGEPILSDTEIRFNGQAPFDDAETFALVLNPDATGRNSESTGVIRSFCKTGGLGYDLAVTAILLRFKQLAPAHVALGSDGDWGTDWRRARALLATHFDSYNDINPLGPTTDGGPFAVREAILT